MDVQKDYYRILGVSRQASLTEIKAAYRKLAKKYHPDLHPGNLDFEERIKQVNEAWEVLGDPDKKFVYDHFFDEPAPKAAKAAAPEPGVKAPRQRTHTRKQWVTTEEKVYVHGEMRIKYRGLQDDQLTTDVLKEVYYRIHPTQAEAFIDESAIYRGARPAFFEAAYTGEGIRLQVPQPVACTVYGASATRHYQLQIHDLILTESEIKDVTKDDGDSFGTLIAHFYGYVLYEEQHETETTTNEMYGETGRREYRTTDNIRYVRYEYYAASGNTYWGNWIRITPATPKKPVTPVNRTSGCLPSLTQLPGLVLALVVAFRLLILLPYLWPLLLIGFFFWLLSGRSFVRTANIVACLFGLGFLAAIWASLNRQAYQPQTSPKEQAAERQVIKRLGPGKDSLIAHYRVWQDYHGQKYSGSFWVSTRAWRHDHQFKQNFSGVGADAEAAYAQVTDALASRDEGQLRGLYQLLDSIRQKRQLDAPKFAEMFVSLIQDIPYSLVLPEACDPALYTDASIGSYLQRPDARCEPGQRFGINSPVEFLATLNGDCDTRTLLAYTVLHHYGYAVALFSSEAYHHSLLGIDLPYNGAIYAAAGHQYVLWETTAPAPPGILSNEIANLDYWSITLKSTP